jgi:energy-converting hydrogenase Eha subunit C
MNALSIVAIAVIVILSIAAVKTAIPNSNASKPCLLGYKAACSFTPISTVILVLGAVVTFALTKGILVG